MLYMYEVILFSVTILQIS